MHGPKLEYRCDHYPRAEMKDAIARQPVCILPVGSVEDHGRHLPLDVDHFPISAICGEVGRRIPGEVLLPAIPYGFEDHHDSKYYRHGLGRGSPVRMVEWWTRISKSGVVGDPTLASQEKGKLWYEATVANLIEFIRESRAFEVRPKLDLHT